MGKIFVIIQLLICMGTCVFAQQDPMYSQYMFNTLAVNPAYAGSRNVLSATALYRSQWVGMEGAPQTQTLSFDTSLPDKNVGLGVQVFNDKIGITKTTGAFASYAYRIRMETSTLAFGLQAGISNYRADYTSVPLNESTPDVAFSQNVNAFLPNFGAGVYFNSDKFYVGLSAPHILNNRLNNGSETIQTNGLVARQYLHLFLMTGYVFDMGENVKLKPSVLVKGVQGAPVQVDANANLWINDVISVGASYRHKSDMSAMFEMQVTPQIRLGYSYDRSITRLVNYNSGSHEIMLRYEFGFDDERILAPRYF
ncbi:PorP/SprF family type IX secretion system membrane protein [Rubrolithibacter danxiaensis]|uniref:PorP/SprF family type IX secretion system membrane protein n=1 Tax=Rubrolithibacter danxiaensis TaxID=3390805 RepID=UPI003BF8D506